MQMTLRSWKGQQVNPLAWLQNAREVYGRTVLGLWFSGGAVHQEEEKLPIMARVCGSNLFTWCRPEAEATRTFKASL